TLSLVLPNSTITAGPTSLTAGQSATYSGSTTGGDTLNWNFDGGAAPGTGTSLNRTFVPAGQFTVSLQATSPQALAASAFDNSNNLQASQRNFRAGDPTPDTRALAVAMPPDVDFENFESAQVHPLQLSGTKLYAVNTPEARLSIFDVAGNG